MKQRSLIKWMVVNDSDMYYWEAKIGYPFWGFTKDWTDACFFEEREAAEYVFLRLEDIVALKVVKVRVILQHIEEYLEL